MTTSAIQSEYEVLLGGTRFITVGPVYRSMSSQWAPKVTSGDTDRDSDPIRSTLGFSDLRGGIGLGVMEGASDTNRLDWGTHDTRYLGHMIHGPVAIGPASVAFPSQRTIPVPTIVGGTPDISVIEEFANELYICFGSKVLKWQDLSTSWSALIHTLPGVAESAIVTRLGGAQTVYLIVACGDAGYAYYDGSTWTNVDSHKADFFVWWDYRLWSIDGTGQLAYATGPGETWTSDAWLPLPDDYATALLTTKSTNNIQSIFVVTLDGSLWEHDAANSKFIKTSLDLPFHRDTGVGTAAWRESLYIPSGLAVYKFNNRGLDAVVDVVGPDRDDGLPANRGGRIVQIVPSKTSFMALVEGEAVDTTAGFLSPFLFDGLPQLIHSIDRNPSTILEHVGNGWQVLWAGGQDGVPDSAHSQVKTARISSAFSKYRLWFSAGKQLWYIDIPQHVINPQNIPDRAYAYTCVSITPWFHANIAEAQKVALNVLAETRNLNANGPSLAVDVGYDYADNWHEIEEFTSQELHDPSFLPDHLSAGKAPAQGFAFRSIRFRIRSTLGVNQQVTPDLTGLTLEYFKRLGIRQKYEFRVTIDLSRRKGNTSAGELRQRLTEIGAEPTLTPFVYKPEGGEYRTYYVKVLQEQRHEYTGPASQQAFSTLILAEV